MMPLASSVKKRATCTTDNVKINILQVVEKLKIFSKNEENLISLLSIVHSVREDIDMKCEIQKYWYLKREGKTVNSLKIKGNNMQVIKETENVSSGISLTS